MTKKQVLDAIQKNENALFEELTKLNMDDPEYYLVYYKWEGLFELSKELDLV